MPNNLVYSHWHLPQATAQQISMILCMLSFTAGEPFYIRSQCHRALSQSDSEIFAKELLLKKHGYPLWKPDPWSWGDHIPQEYIFSGVRIGDVRVVKNDGSFDCIFNIYSLVSDLINRKGVPDKFSPLAWPELDVHSHSLKHRLSTVISSPRILRQVIPPNKSQWVPLNYGLNLELNSYPRCCEGGLGVAYTFNPLSPGTVPELIPKPCVVPIISGLLSGAQMPLVAQGREVQDSNSHPRLQEVRYLFFQVADCQSNLMASLKSICMLNVMQSTGTSTSMEDLGMKYQMDLFML